MNNIECPTCRERAIEIERLREQNRFILEQLEKAVSVQVPKYILTTQTEIDKLNLTNRGGLLNPDGGYYPLKWMSQTEDLK